MEAEETGETSGQGVLLLPVPSEGSAPGETWSCCCCTPPGAQAARTDDTLGSGLTWVSHRAVMTSKSASAGHYSHPVLLSHLCPAFLKPLSKEGAPVYAHTAAADDVWHEGPRIHADPRGGLSRQTQTWILLPASFWAVSFLCTLGKNAISIFSYIFKSKGLIKKNPIWIWVF